MKHVQTHKKWHQIIIEKTSYVFATSSIKNKQNPKKPKHAKVTYNSQNIKIKKYYLKKPTNVMLQNRTLTNKKRKKPNNFNMTCIFNPSTMQKNQTR